MGSSSSSSRGNSSSHSTSHPSAYPPAQGQGQPPYPGYPPPSYPFASPQSTPGARGPELNHGTTFKFRAIADQYHSVEQVQDALRARGLESSNLIIAVDFTKSNEWTGKQSFGGKSLHYVGDRPNPYEEAISSIGRTLQSFDDDNLIPCYGFGDATSKDSHVFSFLPSDQPCQGLDQVLWRYRELVPSVKLAGPTSFAPAIHQAVKVVVDSGNQYHILLIIADGQVTRGSHVEAHELSIQEAATVEAITFASNFPLSIIMVGVGDGPWDVMKDFDDRLPQREFDNFQFVNFTQLYGEFGGRGQEAKKEAMFALRALMEIPEQYQLIDRLRLLGTPPRYSPRAHPVLPPPGPPSRVAEPQFGPPSRVAQPGGTDLYLCPITHEVMHDPVIAADGFTYEKMAIEEWIRKKATSPITNQPLPSSALIPNHNLRSAILEARQRGQI